MDNTFLKADVIIVALRLGGGGDGLLIVCKTVLYEGNFILKYQYNLRYYSELNVCMAPPCKTVMCISV